MVTTGLIIKLREGKVDCLGGRRYLVMRLQLNRGG